MCCLRLWALIHILHLGSMGTQMIVAVVVLSVFLFGDHALVDGQTIPSTFSYPWFSSDSNLTLSGDAVYNVSLRSYDMTSKSALGVDFGWCGRIVYKDSVKMVDKASNDVASFSTSFAFSFHSTCESDSGGYGMAFTFLRSPSSPPPYSDTFLAQYGMCCFDIEDLKESNRAFAVKFGSRRYLTAYPADISDSNVGVVISKNGKTVVEDYNLCKGLVNTTYCKYFCKYSSELTAWIDYDGVGKTLEVRIADGSFASTELMSAARPLAPKIYVKDVALGELLDEDMYVGFSSSSVLLDAQQETHRLSAWNFRSFSSLVPSPPSSVPSAPLDRLTHQSKSQVGLIASICAAAAGAALVAVLLFCCCKYKKQKKPLEGSAHALSTSNSGLSSGSNCRVYTFGEVSSITKNFNSSELLSSGAFGDVYRGTPPGGGSLVAVKRIKQLKDGVKEHGQASFLAETNSLKQIRHRNLLQLRGWCEAKQGLFLVYEFMSNSSLDKWLHPDANPDSDVLSWGLRRHILAGVASGLEYLHEGWVQCVLHRDIKSSNVMLDVEFNACLGDFGLARLVDHRKMQKTTMLAGTLGYMAPEMHLTGRATKETDVYAFGVLVLEVVCGRRPILEMQDGDEPGNFQLLERVWRAHEAGNITKMVDSRLLEHFHTESRNILEDVSGRDELSLVSSGVFQENMPSMANTLHLGLLCCHPNPSERPSMRQVTQWFQSSTMGTVELPSLPVQRPAPVAQYNWMPQTSSDGTTSSSLISSDVTRGSVKSSSSNTSNSAYRSTHRSSSVL